MNNHGPFQGEIQLPPLRDFSMASTPLGTEEMSWFGSELGLKPDGTHVLLVIKGILRTYDICCEENSHVLGYVGILIESFPGIYQQTLGI